MDILAVGLGGFIGSVLRYGIGLLPVKEGTVFPIKTLFINLLGCALIGFLTAMAAKSSSMNPRLLLLLKVGLCGGFTTFSTFALETTELMKNGHTGEALLYVLLSTALGICLIFSMERLLNR